MARIISNSHFLLVLFFRGFGIIGVMKEVVSMYIGIDGGGTKTKVMLADENLEILFEAESGPSSIRTVAFDMSIHNIQQGIESCLEKHPGVAIEGVFAGLGDVTGEDDGRRVAERLREIKGLESASITVRNDVYNAHAGALEGEAGIALIIGTGSVAFGVDGHQKSHRAGGYSYKEGDLGSAYGLGSQALSVLGKALDGRVEKSPLIDTLVEHFAIRNFMDMVDMYDEYHTRRTDVARLAKYVTKHAGEGDENAVAIIETATDEMMLMIKAVDQALDLDKKQIGIIGSLGNADTYYRKRLIEKIHDYDKAYTVFEARRDPAYGACVLAKKLSGQ